MKLGHSDSSQPRPWSTPRAQIRLFSLVCSLCLIIVAIQWAARPENWYWLVPPQTASQNSDVASQTAQTQPEQLFPLDAGPPSRTSHQAPAWISKLEAEDSDRLAVIDDDKFGITAQESALYYDLLSQLQQSEPIGPDAGRTDVLYVNLLQAPQEYRGELLSVSGTARRISRFAAGENTFGFDTLYEAWFFTSDSGNNPWRVVATSLGPGITEVDGQEVNIEMTGLFFKRFGYASNNGTHQAPLLLANSIQRQAMVTSRPIEGSLIPYLTGFAILVGLFVVFVVWQFARDKSQQKHLSQKIEQHQELTAAVDFSKLDVDTSRPVWLPPESDDQ